MLTTMITAIMMAKYASLAFWPDYIPPEGKDIVLSMTRDETIVIPTKSLIEYEGSAVVVKAAFAVNDGKMLPMGKVTKEGDKLLYTATRVGRDRVEYVLVYEVIENGKQIFPYSEPKAITIKVNEKEG